jgi:hypothetical protein
MESNTFIPVSENHLSGGHACYSKKEDRRFLVPVIDVRDGVEYRKAAEKTLLEANGPFSKFHTNGDHLKPKKGAPLPVSHSIVFGTNIFPKKKKRKPAPAY